MHALPTPMLEMMWAQRTRSVVARRALVANYTTDGVGGVFGVGVGGGVGGGGGDVGAGVDVASSPLRPLRLPASIPAPRFGNLSAGRGFALELVVDTASLPATPLDALPLLDCATPNGTGVSVRFFKGSTHLPAALGTAHVLELRLSDGAHAQRWTTDSEARLWLPKEHHAAFVVDGFARVITTVVNGVFGDGGHVPPSRSYRVAFCLVLYVCFIFLGLGLPPQTGVVCLVP